MANPKFEYPNATSPTVTIEFDRGEFQGDIGRPQVNQNVVISDYNEMSSKTYGDLDLDDFELNAQVSKTTISGNIATVESIEDFCRDTIEWGATPFYYTRGDGSGPYKVKLTNTDIKREEYVNRVAYFFALRGVAE